MQMVGVGPELPRATVIVLEADRKSLRVATQDLASHEPGPTRPITCRSLLNQRR